jgi:hypothetical protein
MYMSVDQISDEELKNFWQLVFNQSRVNGAAYFGDRLPNYSWDWPKDTFLQRRLSELRKHRSSDFAYFAPESRKPLSSLNQKRRPAYHNEPKWLDPSASRVEEH